MTDLTNRIDDFGNLWIEENLIRSEISADDFNKRFKGYSTVVVKIEDDSIYAAGNNRENLVKGFLSKGLELKDYRLEPGPFPPDYLIE